MALKGWRSFDILKPLKWQQTSGEPHLWHFIGKSDLAVVPCTLFYLKAISMLLTLKQLFFESNSSSLFIVANL